MPNDFSANYWSGQIIHWLNRDGTCSSLPLLSNITHDFMISLQDGAAELERPLRATASKKDRPKSGKQERRQIFSGGRTRTGDDKVESPGAERRPEAIEVREHIEQAIEVWAGTCDAASDRQIPMPKYKSSEL